MEGKEPCLSRKQEELFAGGKQREPAATRVEGASGGGEGWGEPRPQPSSQCCSSQTDPLLDGQGLMKDGETTESLINNREEEFPLWLSSNEPD